MHFIDRAVLGAILATVVGFAQTSAAQPEPPPDPGSAETLADCPDFVRGAKISTTNIKGGVAFRVTTPAKAHVEELRTMLRQLADFVEEHTKEAMTTSQPSADQLVPLDITVSEIPTGARVTVLGKDVDVIRTQAKTVEELWQDSQCSRGIASR